MSEGTVILCAPLDSLFIAEPGSVVRRCDKCDAEIWLSELGQAMKRNHPDATLLCMACAVDDDVPFEEAETMPGETIGLRVWWAPKPTRETVADAMRRLYGKKNP